MTRAARIRGLYAIVDTATLADRDLPGAAAKALRGGARVLQYRDKTGSPAQRARHAQALQALCRAHDAAFIVNDDIELALASGADGVHLGRGDAAIETARQRLGARAVIGASCYNELARAQSAVQRGADYVAFGSFYPSPTKPAAPRADTPLLRAARQQLAVPLVAIGGITPDNGAALIEAGAHALAVIAGVFAQTDIEAAARRYAALFQQPIQPSNP